MDMGQEGLLASQLDSKFIRAHSRCGSHDKGVLGPACCGVNMVTAHRQDGSCLSLFWEGRRGSPAQDAGAWENLSTCDRKSHRNAEAETGEDVSMSP